MKAISRAGVIFKLPIFFAVAFFINTVEADAQDRFQKLKSLGSWSFFEDGDYCWIATRAGGISSNGFLLMVDNHGEIFLHYLGGGTTGFTRGGKMLVNVGARQIAFEAGGKWAHPVSRDSQSVLNTLLSVNRAEYELSIGRKSSARTKRGRFSLRRGPEAYRTLIDACPP